MKKNFKTAAALLLLLTLITTTLPSLPIPQPEDNEPGITVLGDDDDGNEDEGIDCY